VLTKVIIKTRTKTYLPGEMLGNEFTDEEISRLKKLKAVVGDYENRLEQEKIRFLTEQELEKITSKQKLIDYADQIGIALKIESSKNELVGEILNYIQQLEDQEV